jgi:sugar/nucleoside kinase (ribokinase family)
MTERIVVLGSANMDLVGTATRLPAPGPRRLHSHHGGGSR